MLILLLLPLLAHADDFSDRARQSYAQQEAARDAANVHSQDLRNIAIIQKMIKVERANGGVNATGKCYDTTYDFKRSWKKVDWSAGGISMPIYSEYWPWEQKQHLGFNEKSIDACTFNTQNGYACEVQIGGDEPSYVMCYDKRNVQFQWNGTRLVRYVAPPPSEPTPISACDNSRLDWASNQASCNRIEDSNDRQICMNAAGPEPTCTN
jgi:hypothetical protein